MPFCVGNLGTLLNVDLTLRTLEEGRCVDRMTRTYITEDFMYMVEQNFNLDLVFALGLCKLLDAKGFVGFCFTEWRGLGVLLCASLA